MGYLSSAEATDCRLIQKLAEQAVGHAVNKVVPMDGKIAYNFMIDDNHVLKIASDRCSLDDWRRVVVNAPVLQKYLSVQIPQPTWHILKHGEKEIPALSYERLPGFTMKRGLFAEKDATFRRNYIAQLNEKIYELHQVPLNALPIRPLTVYEQVINLLFVDKEKGARFGELMKKSFAYQASPNVLLHGDLHTGNVCFDGKQIKGLLDFDSLCVGYPIFDFRPDLYKKIPDYAFMVNNYMKKHPSEFSRQVAKDFVRKYKMLFFLFFFNNMKNKDNPQKARIDNLVRTIHQSRQANNTTK